MSLNKTPKLIARNKAIKKMYDEGHDAVEIAKVYNLCPAYIRKIIQSVAADERFNRRSQKVLNDREMHPHQNDEGYPDLTAYEAIRKADDDYARFRKLLDTIFSICELSGYHVEERLVIKDLKTGKVWR